MRTISPYIVMLAALGTALVMFTAPASAQRIPCGPAECGAWMCAGTGSQTRTCARRYMQRGKSCYPTTYTERRSTPACGGAASRLRYPKPKIGPVPPSPRDKVKVAR
jgi:hypothetical protein